MKIPRNSPCPCGSEKKYKHCCHGKAFSWEIDQDGSFQRLLPIEAPLKNLLNDMREDFLRHFEREPGDGDALFLAKYQLSSFDFNRKITETMEKVGLDPAHIYAFQKTGYLITNDNLNVAPGAAIQEWEDAITEFDLYGGDPEASEEGKEFDRLLMLLVEEIDSFIFLFGLVSDKFLNSPSLPEPTDSDTVMSPSQYQALCISRTHRTLRSIKILLIEHMADDVLKLTRTMYENYLHMVFVGAKPEKVIDLVDAVLGLRSGTHHYKSSPNGKEDKRIIVNSNTGTEYSSHISSYRMAETSTVEGDLEFYDFFYRMTSDLIHPSVFSLDGYFSDEGLDAVKPHMYEEGVIFSIAVALMVAERILVMEKCPPIVQQDVKTVLARITKTLIQTLNILNVWQQNMGADKSEIELLLRRFGCIDQG